MNTGLVILAYTVCPTSEFGAWPFLFSIFASSQIYRRNWQAHVQPAKFACRKAKIFLLPIGENVLTEHETFEKFGGGETSKQGSAVEPILRSANNVGQYYQALKLNSFYVILPSTDVFIQTALFFDMEL